MESGMDGTSVAQLLCAFPPSNWLFCFLIQKKPATGDVSGNAQCFGVISLTDRILTFCRYSVRYVMVVLYRSFRSKNHDYVQYNGFSAVYCFCCLYSLRGSHRMAIWLMPDLRASIQLLNARRQRQDH